MEERERFTDSVFLEEDTERERETWKQGGRQKLKNSETKVMGVFLFPYEIFCILFSHRHAHVDTN